MLTSKPSSAIVCEQCSIPKPLLLIDGEDLGKAMCVCDPVPDLRGENSFEMDRVSPLIIDETFSCLGIALNNFVQCLRTSQKQPVWTGLTICLMEIYNNYEKEKPWDSASVPGAKCQSSPTRMECGVLTWQGSP